MGRALPRAAPWAAVLLCGGCAHLSIDVPAYRTEPAPRGGFAITGAARADITPPAGYPMGGHSLAGRVSRGRWGRLYARAFYVRDSEGRSVALVSADLFAVPAGLHEVVAAAVNRGEITTTCEPRRTTPLGRGGARGHPDVGRANLLLAATHTHQSPGNFLSSPFYNSFASQVRGFACEQFDALAAQTAAAVVAAIEDAERHADSPATLAWLRTPPVAGLLRNRAVAALLREDAPRIAALSVHGPPTRACDVDPRGEACVRDAAVDARATVLSITRRDGASGVTAPVGTLVFFAAHATALSDHVMANSPDLAGVAMSVLEKEAAARGHPGLVAGFFNGAEGDVSPRWGRQDATEARALGQRLAQAVATAEPIPVSGAPRVDARRASVRRQEFCKGARPIMGVATLGGAEDGRSFAFDLGWRSPTRSADAPPRRSAFSRLVRTLFYGGIGAGQGQKTPALDLKGLPGVGVTQLVAPASAFPREVPLSVLEVAGLSLLAVPFEMSGLAGLDLRKKSGDPERTLVVGLANEYWSYLVTPKEYDEQDYEGASTLFGRESLGCLADLLARAEPPGPAVPARRFDAGPKPLIPLGPGTWGWNGPFRDASFLSPFLPEGAGLDARFARFEWESEEPDEGVELLTRSGGAWRVAREDGFELVVELVDGCVRRDVAAAQAAGNGRCPARWAVTWLGRPSVEPADPRVLRVRLRDGSSVCSAEFSSPPAEAASLPAGPCPNV